jgi:two-component system cell cycle response regulator
VNPDPLETERLSAVLRQDGLEVATCVDAAEAWAALLEEPHDLVLLSLSLDGADSLRFASRLRAEALTRDLPVLLIGDQAHKSLVLRGFDLGANDHVLRPVDPNELCARVRNQVRRKRYQDMLRADLDRSLELAVTDPLTGLRNRRYVRRHLEGVLRTAAATALMLDVDRFKSVNDTFGHAAGDVVLREVSDRVRSHLRSADVVARYGGEEFLVVMSGADAEDGMLVAERLRSAIAAAPIMAEGQALPVTVSIGIASAVAGTPSDDLIAAADAALYRAKNNGRNRVEAAPDSGQPIGHRP